MIIKKYTGKTEEEAKLKAENELGPSVVSLNVKTISAGGLRGLLGRKSYEVTAAVEEDELKSSKGASKAKVKAAAGTAKISEPAPADTKVSAPVKKAIDINASLEAYNKQISGSKSLSGEESAPVKDTASQAGISRQEANRMSRALTQKRRDEESDDQSGDLEDRIDALQQYIDEHLDRKESASDGINLSSDSDKRMEVIRMLYRTLVSNEVDEHYANALTDELSKSVNSASGLDYILSNAYQKLILKFGEPNVLKAGVKKPKVVFFIGPTGVGKTTTIAKIASRLKVTEKKNIALATSDTYRIAATEQLQIYADILNIPMVVVYTADELNKMIEKLLDFDVILVDTAGFSHKNDSQKSELESFLKGVDGKYEKDVYLVLSATTKYNDLKQIADSYSNLTKYSLIFTKLDETSCMGNLLNIRLYTDSDIAYVTVGQNVPDDIEVFDPQKTVKHLLGGK